MSVHIPPTLHSKAFNCARCQVFAKQDWFFLTGASQSTGFGTQYENKAFVLSMCNSCGEPTIWHGEAMIYPLHKAEEPPCVDLPSDIQGDFGQPLTFSLFDAVGLPPEVLLPPPDFAIGSTAK